MLRGSLYLETDLVLGHVHRLRNMRYFVGELPLLLFHIKLLLGVVVDARRDCGLLAFKLGSNCAHDSNCGYSLRIPVSVCFSGGDYRRTLIACWNAASSVAAIE